MQVTFKYDVTCRSTYDYSTKQYTLFADELQTVDAHVIVATPEEAARIAAQFPKSVGVRGSAIAGSDKGTGYVEVHANLAPNGNNKGTNEAGLKRVRSFVKHCARLGFVFEQQHTFANSIDKDIATL